MGILAYWKAQLLAAWGTQERSTGWRWKPVYLTRTIVLLVWAICFTVVLRAANIWSLKATDNGAASRAQIQREIAHWMSQRTSSGATTSIIAYGSVHRSVFQPGAWLEATIEDSSKPVEARLSICRFTLDASGRIIDVAERSLPPPNKVTNPDADHAREIRQHSQGEFHL